MMIDCTTAGSNTALLVGSMYEYCLLKYLVIIYVLFIFLFEILFEEFQRLKNVLKPGKYVFTCEGWRMGGISAFLLQQ